MLFKLPIIQIKFSKILNLRILLFKAYIICAVQLAFLHHVAFIYYTKLFLEVFYCKFVSYWV